MKIKFSKMQGLGNDFMVFDTITQSVSLTTDQIRSLADRHFGIGFDQLLLVGVPQQPENDFSYRIFNCDGSEVEQCGNGARCFARFVSERGLSNKKSLRVETVRGVIVPEIREDGLISVDMGLPCFIPSCIPFQAEGGAIAHQLQIGDDSFSFSVLSMGNPHAVLLVNDVECAPVESVGPALQSHRCFPQQVNVGFMQLLTRDEIRLRVYERGAGETLSCGSGACAAVVSGIRRGLLNAHVLVHTQGGDMWITWPGSGRSVSLVGPAKTVFTGEIEM